MNIKRKIDFNVYLKKRSLFFFFASVLSIIFLIILKTAFPYFQKFEAVYNLLFFGIATLCITMSYRYYIQRKLLQTINQKLISEVDGLCDDLITKGAYHAFEDLADGFPRLLRLEIKSFSEELLKLLCDAELFKYTVGAIFHVSCKNLPSHSEVFSSPLLSSAWSSDLKEAICHYVFTNKETESLFIEADKNRKIKQIVRHSTNTKIDLFELLGKQTPSQKLEIPSSFCTITPINIKSLPLGFIALFFESPSLFYRIYKSEPIIDLYVLEKIENWKLDDVIKSVFEREILLYTIYLIRKFDRYANQSLAIRNAEEKEKLLKNITQDLTKYMFAPVSYISIYQNNKNKHVFHFVSNTDDEHPIKTQVIPHIDNLLLNEMSMDERQPKFCDISNLGLDTRGKIINRYIIYVPIKFNINKNGKSEETYFGHFGLLRDNEFNEFDHLILSILEENKIDNIVKSLYFL